MLGTNGGGFFNANSAHPFENPNAAHQLRRRWWLIFSIGAGAHLHLRPHGRRSAPGLGALRGHGHPLPGRRRHGLLGRRQRAIPAFAPLGVDTAAYDRSRRAATWRARRSASASPTPPCSPRSPPTPPAARSTAMHDSFTPLGGLVPLVNIQLGEIIFGGVGAGLYGMLLFAIIAVFVAGLMVGRTPEYLGKKIEAKRGEDGHAGDPDPAAVDPGLHRARHGRATAGLAGPANQGRTASARSSTPTPRAPATTAPPSPASPPTRSSTTRPSASRC